MPADGLAVRVCNRHFLQHVLITHEHAGEVHHLAQADDAGPLHRSGHFFGSDMRAGSFQARRRRHTRRHLHPHMDGLLLRFIHHQLHTFEAEHIRDLMWVNEHAGSAAHRHGPHELGDRDHARFDMHVPIEQAGDEEAPLRIDDLRLFADGMTGVLPHIRDMPIPHGHIGAGDDLTRLHAHPLTVADHQVGGRAPHGGINQGTG